MRTPLLPLERIPVEIAAVSDYETSARERVTDSAWAYFNGGAADEITLRGNRDAFDQLKLNSRLLADFSTGSHTRCPLFGKTFDHPIILAPIAYQKLAHSEGELATLLGAAATKTGFIVSTHASLTMEAIASASHTPLWFQLYAQADRGATRELLQRAKAAGYQAIVLTVDAPVSSVRNREQRANFRLPAGIGAPNTSKWPSVLARGLDATALCGGLLASQPTWKDLEWIRAATDLPILLKGVINAKDAALAIERGMSGLVVSNHGGRTLDTLPASIDALPRVAAVVAGRVPILLDGGIRRGTDIIKAIALGASAVLIGRAYLYALAAAGPIGVAHVVNILRSELEVAMALTGCATLNDITRDVIW